MSIVEQTVGCNCQHKCSTCTGRALAMSEDGRVDRKMRARSGRPPGGMTQWSCASLSRKICFLKGSDVSQNIKGTQTRSTRQDVVLSCKLSLQETDHHGVCTYKYKNIEVSVLSFYVFRHFAHKHREKSVFNNVARALSFVVGIGMCITLP